LAQAPLEVPQDLLAMGCGRTRRALPAARLLLLLPSVSEGGVGCGGHEAPACASCPEEHDSSCNGDCAWQRGLGRCTARPVEAMPELDDLLGELGRLRRGLQVRAPELGDRATYIRNAIVGSGSRQRQRELLWTHMRCLGDRPLHLDALFDLLRTPRSAAEAKDVESLVWASLEWHPDEKLQQQMTRTRALLELGLLADALRAGRSMVELDPGFAEARYQLALVLARMGNGTEALEQLDQALQLEPRHFGALAAKGKLLAAAGSRGEVLECLHQVKKVHPHFNCSELEAALEL